MKDEEINAIAMTAKRLQKVLEILKNLFQKVLKRVQGSALAAGGAQKKDPVAVATGSERSLDWKAGG